MQHFEVRALRLITSLCQRLVACLDERAHAATQHSLLAEEIRLRLFLEGRLEHSGARAANALEIAEAQRMSFAGRVLMNSDQARNAAAFGKDLAHAVTRSLRRRHAHVDSRCRHNRLEVDVEAVRKHQQRTWL